MTTASSIKNNYSQNNNDIKDNGLINNSSSYSNEHNNYSINNNNLNDNCKQFQV